MYKNQRSAYRLIEKRLRYVSVLIRCRAREVCNTIKNKFLVWTFAYNP